MDGYRQQLTNDRDLQVNQGVTETALDYLIYRPRYSCSVLVPLGGPAFSHINSAEFLGFPAGANTTGRCSLALPSAFWLRGTVTLRLLWGGDTVSANAVQWAFTMAPTAAAAAPVNLTTTTATTTGVTLANAVLDYTFTTTNNAVDSSHAITGLNITRNGAVDTYPGEARLFAFQLIYTPAAGH